MSAYPPLLQLSDEAAYRAHYLRTYCSGPLRTWDGIEVWFRPHFFSHLFFESSNRDGIKDLFSPLRAERMDWIGATLGDHTALLKQGWIKEQRCYDPNRRVAVVQANYIVVIQINPRRTRSNFITAYVADTPNTLAKILASPTWV